MSSQSPSIEQFDPLKTPQPTSVAQKLDNAAPKKVDVRKRLLSSSSSEDEEMLKDRQRKKLKSFETPSKIPAFSYKSESKPNFTPKYKADQETAESKMSQIPKIPMKTKIPENQNKNSAPQSTVKKSSSTSKADEVKPSKSFKIPPVIEPPVVSRNVWIGGKL